MSKQTSAIVIGGSMSGLLAARILSDHFDTVTVIERDTLPENAEYRSGTPQAHHLHALLAHGQRLMEDMFPGLQQDFDDAGAIRMRWGLDTTTRVASGWIDKFDANIESHVISRITLEWVIRQRIYKIPNIQFMTEQQVNHLLTNDSKTQVVGVHMTSRKTREDQDLYANLVVDASGRSSKTMAWMEELGYVAPSETVINSYLGYATRWYELPEDTDYDWISLLMQSNPKEGLYRGGGILIVEGNRLVVTVAGMNKDYPPTDEDEFLEFTKSLAEPTIYEVIKDLKPISPIYGYRRTENRLRHYEKLDRIPQGFIVMGDAVCGFNPIYGQGMTSAAIQANQLSELFNKSGVTGVINNPLSFQKRVAKAVNGAWLMATGEDLRYPGTDGATPNMIDRATQRYMDWMVLVMTHDTILATAFMNAMNLTIHPLQLFHPKYAMRVLWYKFFNKSQVEQKRQPVEFEAVKTQ